MWALSLATTAGLAVYVWRHVALIARLDILFWLLIVAAVELVPVPVSGGLRLTLAFPILLAIAILYQPGVAGAVALVGSFDLQELRRQTSLSRALFNRSQFALTTLVGAFIIHGLASIQSHLVVLIPVTLLASAASYCVNVWLVGTGLRLLYFPTFRQAVGQLRLGALKEFLLNYMVLGFVGVIIARLYSFSSIRFLSVAAFILPLIFARQMFFRNLALEEAGKELKDREQVLRALSNRMAEERQDERMQIAGYLHDDLAQQLFRLTLQVEMAKKRLQLGELDAVTRDLDGILQTKQQTSDMVRALIRDLHRSPIGRRGLAEAIQSFADDMSRGGPTRISADVVEVALPPPIQLLIYQIAREAATNSLKYAEAENIWISLHETDDGVRLSIKDDGQGFDTAAPQPEGHFGSVMMRERALVAGGTFTRESAPGHGSAITATFPRVWVEEATLASAENGNASEEHPALQPPTGSTAGPLRPGVTHRLLRRRRPRADRPELRDEARPASESEADAESGGGRVDTNPHSGSATPDTMAPFYAEGSAEATDGPEPVGPAILPRPLRWDEVEDRSAERNPKERPAVSA
jgi:signal transduction histidine kinase